MSNRLGIAGAAALCLLAALAGCDVLEQARELKARQQTGQDKFGMATRVRAPGGAADQFEVIIESTQEATKADALLAMSLQEKMACDDGGVVAYQGSTPHEPPDPSPAQEAPVYPAGTVFTFRIRCASQYPNTISYPHDLPHDQARERAHAALPPAPAGGDWEVQVHPGAYHTMYRKYPAVTQIMGRMLMTQQAKCADRGGAVIRDLVLLEEAANPDPPLGPDLGTREFHLAARIGCAEPAVAPAPAP